MKIRSLLLCSVVMLGTSFFPKDNHALVQNSKAVHRSAEDRKSQDFKKSSSARDVYNTIDFGSGSVLSFDVFEKAFVGFENLKKSEVLSQESRFLSICDFSLSSNKRRLWVIDTKDNRVVFNTLVAHGKGTGDEFASQFSNVENSHQSSLGFYITESTYIGENGYSLKLEGVDKGYNDAAMRRAIVVHGADYVSEEFIKKQKRLGRSWGCPALPRAEATQIIDVIKDKTCLFIYYPDLQYLASSEWLNMAGVEQGKSLAKR